MKQQLKQAVDQYFEERGVSRVCPADVVLALLRINTPEALQHAEELVGRPITRCPPDLPPWPPKPAPRPRCPVLTYVCRNGKLPTTDAFQRYRKLRVGLSEQQLRARGVTKRDVTAWTRAGLIRWSESK